MDQRETDHTPARRFGRFSLATVFILMSAVAIAVAIWIELNKQDVTAYLLFLRSPGRGAWPAELADTMSDAEFARYRATQVELMRSQPLLVRALRDPAMGKLPLIQGQSDPVEWLQSDLQFEFPGDGELLRIRLRCRDEDQGVKIVNAVIDAYFREYVEREIAERNQIEDRLRKSYEELSTMQVREQHEVENLRSALDNKETPELRNREARADEMAEQLRAMQRQLHRMRLQKQAPMRVQRVDEAMKRSAR